ncbi:MAG: Glu/Leu/Phe/Val dehydrogenase [Limnochordaceae bacterium]|nr:Glu/Leu/Phe/Val dehydrogenase [Limnochordaceae bacterium]
MTVFESIARLGPHEQVVFAHDPPRRLRMIIAVHDTTLGPALGGCRMWPYRTEEEALEDVLRLSRAMTYKNSIHGLRLGGGKSVIIGDPRTDKTSDLFEAAGEAVERLQGRYITAEDVGTNAQDMVMMRNATAYVAGLPQTSGDPSPFTALGVFRGIQACAQALWGSSDLDGRRVAIQGVGSVGFHLARHLVQAGARVTVTDIRPEKILRAVEQLGVDSVEPDAIFDVPCDVFSPCALGGAINDDTIPRIKAPIIAGAANNQLAEPRHGDILQQRGVIYAPDYVINGGGVINVAEELTPEGYSAERARAKVERIFDRVLEVIELSRRRNIPTYRAADEIAWQRVQDARAALKAHSRR